MSFFKSYIKEKQSAFIIFFLFSAIFLCVYSLYHLPMGAIIYPALICIVLGCIFLFFDYKKAYQKHCLLMEMQKLSSELMEHLPKADTISEQDYLNIIETIRKEQKHINTLANIQYAEISAQS